MQAIITNRERYPHRAHTYRAEFLYTPADVLLSKWEMVLILFVQALVSLLIQQRSIPTKSAPRLGEEGSCPAQNNGR